MQFCDSSVLFKFSPVTVQSVQFNSVRERADLAILTGLVDGPVRERADSAIPTGLVAGPVRERGSSALCRRVAVQLCVGEWQFCFSGDG